MDQKRQIVTLNAPPRLFITGTDTGIGKTHVTCLLARQLAAQGLTVGVYKPVCSGANLSRDGTATWDDPAKLLAACGHPWPADLVCPQRFLAPLAPPLAARLEGTSVCFRTMIEGAARFPNADLVLIEGAGGWLSPVTETQTVADLVCALNVPVLIVARAGLGTINQTLLTIESIRRRRQRVAGVILNQTQPNVDSSVESNAAEIEGFSGAPVLGLVEFDACDELHRDGVAVTINWQKLASSE